MHLEPDASDRRADSIVVIEVVECDASQATQAIEHDSALLLFGLRQSWN